MQQPRGDDGQFVSLREFVMMLMDQRLANIEDKFAAKQQALELQAREYERRLEDLNHAHARAQDALNTFVSIDKYEDQVEAETLARKIALDRLDEKLASLDRSINQKLDDYITKAEARQNEIDLALSAQEGAAMEAQLAAEEQGRKSDSQARELARKTNRNMAILGFVVAIIIAISNWLGA